MTNPYAPFITNEIFRSVVQDFVSTLKNKASPSSQASFERNVIDPFAMLLEMHCFGMSYSEWSKSKSEQHRQAQKSLSNKIGLLHQRILGSVQGWQDAGTGSVFDLINPAKKSLQKSKINTIQIKAQTE